MRTFESRSVRRRLRASRKHTRKRPIPGSRSSSLKSLLRSVLRLNFMRRELSLEERLSIRSTLISILRDGSETSELLGMRDNGTLPTPLSTEFESLMAQFRDSLNG